MMSLMPVLRNSGLLHRPRNDFFRRFFEDFDFPTVFSDDGFWLPKIDVSETDKEFVVKAEVSGMTKDDIDITISDGLLTLSGEKKCEETHDKEKYHVIEREYGSFRRSLRLPEDVKTDEIDAAYKDGVLTVSIPKSESVQPKKIEIKS